MHAYTLIIEVDVKLSKNRQGVKKGVVFLKLTNIDRMPESSSTSL